jgi:hypothetical protein
LCFDHVSAVVHHIQVSFSAAENRQGDLEIWERGVHVAENRQGDLEIWERGVHVAENRQGGD